MKNNIVVKPISTTSEIKFKIVNIVNVIIFPRGFLFIIYMCGNTMPIIDNDLLK